MSTGLERLAEGGSERIGSNTVVYDRDNPVFRAVSFFETLDEKLLFFSSKVGSYPREGTQRAVRDYLRSSNLENVTVRLGHARPWEDTKRLFTDGGLKDISLLGRVLFGVPTTLLAGVYAKLTRADHYNPFTRTVHVYSDVEAIARHELGHAQDFQNKGFPTIYSLIGSLFPPFKLYQEFKASQIAHRTAPHDQKWQTGRYLFPAYATYVAAMVFAPITILGRKMRPLLTGGALATIGTIVGGHVVGRLFNKIKGYARSAGYARPAPQYA